MNALESFLRDTRHAIRSLSRAPGFTLVALLTLGLSIGGTTAIFSVVNAVLLRPLPYKDPSRLVMIWQTSGPGQDLSPVTPADYADWRDRSHVFEQIGISSDGSFALTGEGEPELLLGYRFSHNFFDVMGTPALIGRTFLEEEDRPGVNSVVVLSYGLWQRRFHGEASVLGRSILLNGIGRTVVGVMPEGFDHPGSTQLWVPLSLPEELKASRTRRLLRLVGRLRPGVSLDQAGGELSAIAADLQKLHPETNAGMGVRLVSLRDTQVGDIRPALLALLGAGSFLLLIASANIANLLLARVASRRQEMAMRMALGAGGWRIARQLLTESLVLSLGGGALGLLLAVWIVEPMRSMFPTNVSNMNIPRIDAIPLDGTVLAFATGLSFLSGVLFGMAPVLQSIRWTLAAHLKQGERGGDAGGHRVRRILVLSQVALALILLTGAGLTARSFSRLQSTDLGLRTREVLSLRVQLPASRYPKPEDKARFLQDSLARLRALPGVQAAGAVNYLPLSGWWGTTSFTIEGRAAPAPGEVPEADIRVASSGYFETLGISMVRGRAFTEGDDARATQVAIVNESLARKFFPGDDPVGRRLNRGSPDEPEWWQVVGLVRDIRHFGPGEPPHAELYVPFAQSPSSLQCFVVRTAGDPLAIAPAARAALWTVDRDQPISHVARLDELASEAIGVQRVSAVLIGAFGFLALLVAAIGIYGVMSYAVTQRSHEIGVRLALGASPGNVLGLVMRQGMAMAGWGAVVGLAGSIALTRALSSLLFGISPTDPATFGSMILLLGAVAAAACGLPALRATRVDPLAMLREE